MKKSELVEINNLKTIIRNIRNYMAGNAVGITRDETIVSNLMLIIFCKIFDELSKNDDDETEFVVTDQDTDKLLQIKINCLFEKVRTRYSDIFTNKDKISLSPKDLRYIVSNLQNYRLYGSERDVVADAFEELIGVAFRGGEGQFFTPKNVIELMVKMLDPEPGSCIIDPACGSAGFLVYSYLYSINKNRKDVAYYGIEKDSFLSKISKMYAAVLGMDSKKIVCDNSLLVPMNWESSTKAEISLNKFNYVITNPPFGAKIPISDKRILNQFHLGHIWKYKNRQWVETSELCDKQPPQILFIERIIQLLKDGGKAAIVLPDGTFGNKSDRYIWEYVKSVCQINAVISLNHEAFLPSTHTKTSILFITKNCPNQVSTDYKVFMANVQSCGHDKNGKVLYLYDNAGNYILDDNNNKIIDDETAEVFKVYEKETQGKEYTPSHLGFSIDSSKITENIYVPSTYLSKITQKEVNNEYEIVTIGSLVDQGLISISRGNEIGSKFYGTGTIPFVRTSDIVNWEIKADPVKAVSEEAYEKFRKSQNVEEDDILFVNDGTFLIGRSAMVSKIDSKCVIQSHLRHIKVLHPEVINPFYLFYLLNTDFVQSQVKAKTFIQATISTLGDRLSEIELPLLKDQKERDEIAENVEKIFKAKRKIKRDIASLMSTCTIKYKDN